MIRALNEAGIRAVYSYHRGAGDKHQYPQDIKRLQKTHFSSKDQLLTLALTANLNANVYSLAREVGVQVVQHLVGNDLNKQVTDLPQAGLMRPGDEYIHCIGINDATWKLLKDAGAEVSLCAPIDMTMGHGTPTIQEALDHGFRPSLSSDHGVIDDAGHVLADAGDVPVPAPAGARTPARGRQERAGVPQLPRPAGVRHHRGRALRPDRQQGRHAHARQGCRHRDAARPIGSTSGRSATPTARW